MEADAYLGKLVVAKTAQGAINFAGKCIGYCDAPTVIIHDSEGGQHSWRADLCEVLPIDEEIVQMLLPRKNSVGGR